MDNIITVNNLIKSFGTEIKTTVLHGIDFTFNKGEFTAIIGPSGSGKTTFLNIISLLDYPTSGTLTIDGQDFSDGRINNYSDFRNKNIGFIFQFHYLLPEFTCLENILIPYMIGTGRPSEKIIKNAETLMNNIGILKIKNKYPNQISGGQQQRVSIARALINEPKIIFADEPTGNLDHESGIAVLEIMSQLVYEKGTTLIMVTHDREIALKSQRIIEFIDGKVCKIINNRAQDIKKIKKKLEDRSCFVED